ncbi:MAG TPA: hypothetical protein VN806_12375 [Caulobacteraceae bacterium]|nr:hypothetical protein [Caulobacteraceae bacterium]
MQDDSSPAAGEHSVYIPLLIGLVALVALLGFQGIELWQIRGALTAQREGQNAATEASEKMRQQFATIASKTADLAQKGDPDAKAVVDAYAKRGLQFLPTKPKS